MLQPWIDTGFYSVRTGNEYAMNTWCKFRELKSLCYIYIHIFSVA